MDDFVRDMHTTSGLLDELDARRHAGGGRAAGPRLRPRATSPSRARRRWAATPSRTDRGFLARDMPELEAHLHYRIIDVSSIKELSRRWYPRAYFNAPKKSGGHRALADIRESIAELRYYREAVFVPQPGPDSATAKALARPHVIEP